MRVLSCNRIFEAGVVNPPMFRYVPPGLPGLMPPCAFSGSAGLEKIHSVGDADATVLAAESTGELPRITSRTVASLAPYGLKSDEIPPELAWQLDQFYADMTVETFAQIEPAIRPATASIYLRIVKLALGWAHRNRDTIALTPPPSTHLSPPPMVMKAAAARVADGSTTAAAATTTTTAAATTTAATTVENGSGVCTNADIPQIKLQMLIPSSSASAAEVAFQYLKFVREERNGSSAYQASITRAFIKLAKFMFKDEVGSPVGGNALGRGAQINPFNTHSDRPFDQLGVVQALRKLHRQSSKTAKKSTRVAEVGQKWIPWPQVLQMVETLRKEAAVTDGSDEEDGGSVHHGAGNSSSSERLLGPVSGSTLSGGAAGPRQAAPRPLASGVAPEQAANPTRSQVLPSAPTRPYHFHKSTGGTVLAMMHAMRAISAAGQYVTAAEILVQMGESGLSGEAANTDARNEAKLEKHLKRTSQPAHLNSKYIDKTDASSGEPSRFRLSTQQLCAAARAYVCVCVCVCVCVSMCARVCA